MQHILHIVITVFVVRPLFVFSSIFFFIKSTPNYQIKLHESFLSYGFWSIPLLLHSHSRPTSPEFPPPPSFPAISSDSGSLTCFSLVYHFPGLRFFFREIQGCFLGVFLSFWFCFLSSGFWMPFLFWLCEAVDWIKELKSGFWFFFFLFFFLSPPQFSLPCVCLFGGWETLKWFSCFTPFVGFFFGGGLF